MNYQHVGITKTATESFNVLHGERPAAIYANLQRHPTEKVGSAQFAANEERRELQEMSILYGSHMPMRAVVERSIMAQATRGVGQRSNHFGLHSAMGNYHVMGVQDTFSDPYEQPEPPKDSLHARAEKIYGL